LAEKIVYAIEHPDERARLAAKLLASRRKIRRHGLRAEMERLYTLLHQVSPPLEAPRHLVAGPVVFDARRGRRERRAFALVVRPLADRPAGAMLLDVRPGLIAAALVFFVYGGMALSVDFPRRRSAFKATRRPTT
jgi:hypothetical protein